MKKTGHKIWNGIAILLSGIVLLVCVLGIAGIWITERALSNSVVQIIDAVENASVSMRQVIQGLDGKLENMQTVSTYLSTISGTISENVKDQGLIKLLLPPEQEQNLIATTTAVAETIGSLRDTLLTGITIYRSIDQLPFINLPYPNQEQVNDIEKAVGDVQAAANDLAAEITAFRSNVAAPIDKIGTGADNLTSRLGQARDRLTQLDARLAITQDRLESFKQTASRLLFLISFLMSLLLAWVIYSQVELINLYIHRWKASGQGSGSAESSNQTADQENAVVIQTPSSAPGSSDDIQSPK